MIVRVRVKMRVASNQSYRAHWNILGQITSIAYHCIILFRICVRDTATEKYVTRIHFSTEIQAKY